MTRIMMMSFMCVWGGFGLGGVGDWRHRIIGGLTKKRAEPNRTSSVIRHGEAMEAVALIASGEHSRLLLCRSSDGSPVLLKATRLSDEHTATRARRELELASSHSSDFVVKALGALWITGEIYLRLDYLSGGDVELLIDREGSLTPAASRFYAGCLALALECLHENGIIHRDVKPDNLCIAADGYAKLVDLAYGGRLPTDGDGRLHTLLGTPEYLSPEAFTGRGQGRPSDLWAFGVSLYMMLIAAHPWDAGETPQQLYSNVLDKPPFFPQNIISHQAKSFVNQCLSHEEGQRPSAASVWSHPFFCQALPPSAPRGGLSHDELLHKSVPPPFVPRLRDLFDTQLFEPSPDDDDDDDWGRDEEAAGGADGASMRDAVEGCLGPLLTLTQPDGQTSVALRRGPSSRSPPGGAGLTLAAGAEVLTSYTLPSRGTETPRERGGL